MTIEELARAIVEADDAGDGKSLAGLAHADVLRDFAKRQIEMLEHTPGRRGSSAVLHIVQKVYNLDSVAQVKELEPLELLSRAFAARYRALPPVRSRIRMIKTIQIDDGKAYGVFVTSHFHDSEAKNLPGVVRPVAMTFVRQGDAWRSFLDGALGFDALRVFAPDEYVPRAAIGGHESQ